MLWKKVGLVYNANKFKTTLKQHSALAPEPILIDENIIRVFFGGRDEKGISRIFFADVDARNPKEILHTSNTPSLDIGEEGCFDDNGVIPGHIELVNNEFYFHYVGFQIPQKTKFLAFSGLAKSKDGEFFNRTSDVPFLDRQTNQKTICAIHTARKISPDSWRYWYASGNDFELINNIYYPKYHIRTFSEDKSGKKFQTCITPLENEYRIGRPKVYILDKGRFVMYMTKGNLIGNYDCTVAFSLDGLNWTRHDDLIGIEKSLTGWDSKHLCYPALIFWKDLVYMFYNGNNMGFDGFGVAVCSRENWERTWK